LGYVLVLMAFAFITILAIVFAIGAGEHLIGGDLTEAQDKLRTIFAGPAIVIVGLGYLLLLVAKLNIMTKRIRDMGLSGWWILLAIVLVLGSGSGIYSQQTGAFTFSTFSLLLLLIPSNMFGKKS
jgi:uncharacterized membrane protein YhaH (DUF805 family)